MRIGKPIQAGQTITIKKKGTNSDIIDTIHGYMPYAINQSKWEYSGFYTHNYYHLKLPSAFNLFSLIIT